MGTKRVTWALLLLLAVLGVVQCTPEEKEVKVKEVSLSKTALSLEVGKTAKLTATIAPEDATNTKVTWASNKAAVATVDQEGLVTAKTKGEATITVTTEDGGKTSSCKVTVKEAAAPGSKVKVTEVTLDKTTLSLEVGKTAKLTATIAPEDATNAKVTWASDKETIATVDQEGLVTAKAKGEAIITVTTEDGGKTASCKVTVKEAAAPTIAVTGITLSHSNFTLEIGATATLIATITPNNASNKKVTWSSNNETVAAVSEEGVVTAKAKGAATITVTTKDGGKTAQCTVTVQETAAPGTEVKVTGIKLNWTALSLLQGTRRHTLGGGTTIFAGETFQLTATVLPNDATNKNVTWTSSDESVVKVDQTGKLTVIITSSKDEATIITATTEDGGKTATCEVYIHNNIAFPPQASSITLDKTEIKWTHVDHETAQLTATIAPTNSNDKKVIWSSDNALVATVDQNGKVTEMGYGEATITACASKKRSVFATCTVKSTSPLPPHPPIIIPKP